jgi:hypothetical protein
METERSYQQKTPRTIQQKRSGDGAMEFTDNRPNELVRAMQQKPVQRQEDDEDVLQGKFGHPIQREEEEEDTLQGKFDPTIQRIGEEEEDTLQGKFEQPIQKIGEEEDDTLQGKFEQPLQRMGTTQLKKNETGMPDQLKTGIEDLSGFNMDDVRVHYNSDKPATVQALAYTQGTDIHVAPGQEQHLPHEAWHVAQQMAGRVEPTTEVGGLPVNDNHDLEHEADVMGSKAGG